MRNLKWFWILMFLLAIACAAAAREKANKTIFADSEELAHTTAAVTENEIYAVENELSEFSNAEADVVFMGQSRLNFTAEDGKEYSVKFDYGFSRMPQNGQVSVMYDKANPKKVSLEGFDYKQKQASGMLMLLAYIFLILGYVFLFLLYCSCLMRERRIYKKEQKVYGQELSGYKAVFYLKLFAMLMFISGMVLCTVFAAKIAVGLNDMPLLKNDMCGIAEAVLVQNEDGSKSYSFTAPNGEQITKQLSDAEKLITDISDNANINVRYLLSEPNNNCLNNPLVCCAVNENDPLLLIFGCVCYMFALLFTIAVIVAEILGKRERRRRGYVDYFKATQEDIDRMMNE